MNTAEEFECEHSVVDNMPVEYLTRWEFAEAYAQYREKHYAKELFEECIEQMEDNLNTMCLDETTNLSMINGYQLAQNELKQLLKRIKDGNK